MELYGMSFNLLDDEAHKRFEEISECETVVADAAGWATDFILKPREED